MFSRTTVESSTSRPIASANPPSVMMLMVEPLIMQAERAGQNRERDRQKDRDRRTKAAEEDQDHQRGEHRAGDRFMLEAFDRRPDIGVLAEDRVDFHPSGRSGILDSIALTPSTTAIVLALPCFSTGM